MRQLGGSEWAAVALVGLLFAPLCAVAQSSTGMVVDRLAPMPGRRGNVVNLATSEVHPHFATDLGLTMHYIDTPLRLVPVDSTHRASDIVANQLKADLAGTIGLFDWASLTLAMPLVLQQSGGDLAALGEPGQSIRGVAAGDFRVLPKVQLLNPSRALGVGVAVMAPLYLPTGDTQSFNSEGKVRGGLTLIVDWRLAKVLVTANVGYELRAKQVALQYRSGSVIPWGIGGQVDVGPFDLQAFANVFGAVPTVKNLDPSDLRRATSQRSLGPIEALLGVRAPLPLNLSATLAGGMGLTSDVGAPQYRLLAALSYEFDALVPAMHTHDENINMMQVSDAAPVVQEQPPLIAEVAAPAPHDEEVVAPQEPPSQAAVLTRDRIEITERFQFATGSDILLSASLQIVTSVAAVLHQHPELVRVVIEGHTDNQGRPRVNLALSKARAQAVVNALIAEGIAAERLEAQGFGASRPLAPNNTARQRFINRRVEIRVEPSIAVTQH